MSYPQPVNPYVYPHPNPAVEEYAQRRAAADRSTVRWTAWLAGWTGISFILMRPRQGWVAWLIWALLVLPAILATFGILGLVLWAVAVPVAHSSWWRGNLAVYRYDRETALAAERQRAVWVQQWAVR